ncbi:30S ribosomal protein S20 [Candidatus Omnitrophota bacterium]
MANKKAAIKSLRQDKKKHVRNRAMSSELHTLLKKARVLVDEKKREEADVALRKLESKMDRAVKKDLIKKNNASRHISRLRSHWSKIEA